MEKLEAISQELSRHPHAYIRSLALSYFLRAPVIRAALDFLDFPAGTRGLDLGCGIGLPAVLAALRQNGCIQGVDPEPDFIETARKVSARACPAGRLEFLTGQGNALEFKDHCFDWAWSTDCVNYTPGLGRTALDEMKRVLKPGGVIALMAWSSQVLLPGYPLLEARLNATPRGLAPHESDTGPDRHFLGTGRLLKELGFSHVRAVTLPGEIRAPLSGIRAEALADLLAMRWGDTPEGLDDRDLELYRSLTDPASRDCICNDPDYYGFFTYTLFTGVKTDGQPSNN